MSKVTYEEAKETVRSLNDFEDVHIKDLVTFKTTEEFDRKIKILNNFIEQSKPPTLEEIKSWWEYHDGIVEVYDGGIEIMFSSRSYTITKWGELKIELPNNEVMNNIGISQTQMRGIELTIRYLQSKETKDE